MTGLIIALLILAWLATVLGWQRRARPWAAATGFDRIPASARPGDPVAALIARQQLRIGWLGHSGFVIEWAGQVILLDPNTSAHCCFVAPRLLESAGDLGALPRIDAICLSHAHYDHLDMPTLRAARDVQRVVLPAGCEAYLGDALPGAQRHPLHPGDSVACGDIAIHAVPAAHNGSRFHPLKSTQPALGYVLTRGGFSVYFAGDTGRGNDFAGIAAQFHPDLAILPIGAYDPKVPLRKVHMSPEEAVSAAKVLGARAVIPCHFGTFRLSFDDPREALPRFAAAAKSADLPWSMPVLWQPGER